MALLTATFSSISETALTAVSRIKIKHLAEEGSRRARRVENLHQKPNTLYSTILVINNTAVILATAMAEALALKWVGVNWATVVTTLVMTIIVLIFCEITPKSYAAQHAEGIALTLAGPVSFLAWLMTPVVFFFGTITNLIFRLFGIKGGGGLAPLVTEEELRTLVSVGEEQGVIEEEEKEMIHGIFELGEKVVREVMVPRIDITAAPSDAKIPEVLQKVIGAGHSRIPVYEGSIENIIGILYAKDLFRYLQENRLDIPIKEIVREAYFVPETKRVDDLLRELQRKKVHMAIVVDEYGSIAGLVTIEDLLEEIVGEIQDEFDAEEQMIQMVSDREAVVDARVSWEDINELFSLHITEEGYDSLGGFIYDRLGELPEVGDQVTVDNVNFSIESMEGRRVNKVRIVKTVAEPEEEEVETRGEKD